MSTSTEGAFPELLTRREAAKFLRVSVSKLSHGFGPTPLPQYRPRIMYLRQDLEEFLTSHRDDDQENTPRWRPASSSVQDPASTTSASSEPERSTQSRQESEIAKQLRRSPSVGSAKSSSRGRRTGGHGGKSS